MKKFNKKGMTLTEVIIAMCILGVIASMFVTVAVAAKKKNADTAVRSREMYEQANAAETFNTSVSYDTGTIKVGKMLTGSNNEVKISADFKTIKFDTNAYAYKVTRREKDSSDKNYNLRFFRCDNVNIATPNPAEGKYWLKVFNHTGMDLGIKFLSFDGGFFGADENHIPDPGVVIANENFAQMGYKVGDAPDLFRLVDYDDNSVVFGTFSEDNIEKYMEVIDGKRTGFISIHICDGLEIKSQSEFEGS